jgi:hypothetical protein
MWRTIRPNAWKRQRLDETEIHVPRSLTFAPAAVGNIHVKLGRRYERNIIGRREISMLKRRGQQLRENYRHFSRLEHTRKQRTGQCDSLL